MAAPTLQLNPVGGQDVFEIRLHADREANDLVVYTTSTSWTMPAAIWTGLSANVVDQPITVSVRGLTSSSGQVARGASETIDHRAGRGGGDNRLLDHVRRIRR